MVLIEMRMRGADRLKHYRRASDYCVRLVSDRPRYVRLCSIDEFWFYGFNDKFDSSKDNPPC